MEPGQTVYLTRKVETFGATYQYGEPFTVEQIDQSTGLIYLTREDAAGHRSKIDGVGKCYVQVREPLKWDSVFSD